MRAIEAIFFDLDGTIVDTEPLAAIAIQACFSEWGVRLDLKDAHFINGRKWEAAFEFLFRKYRVPVPAARASDLILQRYRELLQKELKTVPGAPDAVRRLGARFPLGLVSGSNRTEILWALDRLGLTDQFKVILGAEDYPASKPSPDGYLAGLELMGVEAGKSLVFEDSHAGIASGRSAGMWVVGVKAANHLQQDQSRAHWLIEDFTSIDAAWVRALA